jgi:hypothetical protein
MAGAGYKLFATGDVLTAAQVNTYLNEQTVMVFADSAARTAALSGVLAEGMVSYLQDTNAVEVYNASSWVNVGNAGDITEVQAGVGISVASGTGPIPVITNSSTDLITTAGDLLYGTAADTVARLGIGTAGQILQVNSGANAPEWAAPAGGASGLTLITQNTFSNVANVTIDSVFSTTYRNYIAYINYYSTTNADDFQLQWRYSSTTLTSSVYYGAGFNYNGSNTLSTYGYSGAGQATLAANTGSSTRRSSLQINFNEVGTGSSVNPHFFGIGFSNQGEQSNQFAGMPDATQNFTGFLLKSSSANITGEYQVYGLAI